MSTPTLQIETARVFLPFLKPSRYKGVHGGRGSGKSHFFADLMVESAMLQPGFRAVCIREVQKSLKDSAKRLIEDKIETHQVGRTFRILDAEIRTPGGGVVIFQGMQDHTAESIKSLEGFDVAWVEEAQSLSQRSLTMLRPTIRKPGSELWFSWNRTRKKDPVDVLLTGATPPTGAIVHKANWRDNPWFPAELDQERRDDKRDRPDSYEHVWEGDYAKVIDGAYYATQLADARRDGRIGHVAPDPMLQRRAYCDIGGAGAKADAMAIWIVQFVGREIWVLDYIEGQGQVLGYYAAEMRRRGHGEATIILPHDGVNTNNVTGKRYAEHWEDAGFTVEVIPNQGMGAAMMRIEAARRLFPRIWFNEKTTDAGRDALGSYHENRDEDRDVGLGPLHDWSSNGADAFGLMCVAYEEPRKRTTRIEHTTNMSIA